MQIVDHLASVMQILYPEECRLQAASLFTDHNDTTDYMEPTTNKAIASNDQTAHNFLQMNIVVASTHDIRCYDPSCADQTAQLVTNEHTSKNT